MFIIGITGLSCSGKTTLSQELTKSLGNSCLLLSTDNYFKELTDEQSKILYDDEALINFDEPNAMNYDLLISHLDCLINKKPFRMPRYDLGSCIVNEYVNVDPNDYKYVILEGVLIFCNDYIKDMCNLKIWVETNDYLCALRRFIKYTRDIKGYSSKFVLNQCVKHVIPGQEKYIKPTKAFCDLIYKGESNDKAYIDMIIYLIKLKSSSN